MDFERVYTADEQWKLYAAREPGELFSSWKRRGQFAMDLAAAKTATEKPETKDSLQHYADRGSSTGFVDVLGTEWRTNEYGDGWKPQGLFCGASINAPSPADEVRVTDASTGGAKGSKPNQLGWAAPAGLKALGEVYGFGATKYSPTNYRKGYKWSLSLNAMWRHLLAFQAGENFDKESGLPHLAHAAWHCLTLIQYAQDHPELDDRHGGPAEQSDVGW